MEAVTLRYIASGYSNRLVTVSAFVFTFMLNILHLERKLSCQKAKHHP